MAGERVLVVEDDEALRETIKDLLELEGYAAYSACDGESGAALAREHIPDVIICDVMMPVLDGHGMLAELRHNPATAAIPFIFLSARSSATDIRQGMDLGADDYLTKPFSRDALLKAVVARLARHTAAHEHADAQLTDLRASISLALPHEFRTPLQGMLSSADMLRAQCESLTCEEIKGLADIIVASAQRMDRLVRKYILYTKIESALRDPAAVEACGREHVESVLDAAALAAMATAQARGRAADLVVNGRDAGAAISEMHLHQIVCELVENACQFSAAGSPIEVSVDCGDRTARLTVKDSGWGMSPEQIARIGAFMQFNRRQHEQQGIGLGLAIVQGLVQLHRGTLDIASDPGRGTAVNVQLPR